MADHGIRHVYIKPRTPQLNGKVERSHRTDQQECYQLLSDKGDADLEQRLTEWEAFDNYHRPHGAFGGKTPYEALRERLQYERQLSCEARHITGLGFGAPACVGQRLTDRVVTPSLPRVMGFCGAPARSAALWAVRS